MSQKGSKSAAGSRGKEKAGPSSSPPLQVVRLDELQGTVEQLVAHATAHSADPSAAGASGEWEICLFGIVVHAVGRIGQSRLFGSPVFVLLPSVFLCFSPCPEDDGVFTPSLTLYTPSFLPKDWHFPAEKTECDSGARPSACAHFPGSRLGGADAG